MPLLRGEQPPWRNSVLIEYYSDTVFPRIRDMGYRAVRTGRYKYIRFQVLEGMNELYDLQADPYELDNLIGTAREPELLPMLVAELEELEQSSQPGGPDR